LIEAIKEGDNRFFVVRASRVLQMPEGMRGPLTYGSFAKVYGETIIEKEQEPVIMSSQEQIAEFNKLIETNEIGKDKQEEWLKKTNANADSWSDVYIRTD